MFYQKRRPDQSAGRSRRAPRLDSQRQILAYALQFGYAQQLGTRFIDNRAQSILDSLPSKDPEAKQPTPPLRPVPVAETTVAETTVAAGAGRAGTPPAAAREQL